MFISPLRKIEYEYIPKPELKDRRFFRKGSFHLYICEYKGTQWVEKNLFRDYLRLHPKAAEEYAQLKKELIVKYIERPTYTKGKEPFIKRIIEKAKMERNLH
ncbi:GrpB family protein [Pseudalkalibacillus hwajinpoensis]|uniref:GrpB family protein n=1 Tax=Guptibacillus hwajinpoensis TaxID=208199 RepID=UPI00325B130D